MLHHEQWSASHAKNDLIEFIINLQTPIVAAYEKNLILRQVQSILVFIVNNART